MNPFSKFPQNLIINEPGNDFLQKLCRLEKIYSSSD